MTAARTSTPSPHDGDASARRRRGWPLALFTWSLLYVLPHLYWALGGDALLFMVDRTAVDMDDWRGINWAASAVLTAAALLGPALVWSTSRPTVRALALAACGAGAAIAASHGAFGIVYRALNVAGLTGVEGAAFDATIHEWVLWDLLVFEPWFLIEGLLFIAAGSAVMESRHARRSWNVGCLTAIGLAALTGLLGLRV